MIESYLQQYDTLRLQLFSQNEGQVTRALAGSGAPIDRALALLSPAAEQQLPKMMQSSQTLTRQRFGYNMALFIPIYLSNLCANECSYCGFSMSNKIKRKTLSMSELKAELEAIKRRGFDSVLLVAGEHERKVGPSYFKAAISLAKSMLSYVALEVQPLSQQDYQQLSDVGLDSVLVYQETYHRQDYAKHHLKGKKQDFIWRLHTPQRLAEAGLDKIGLGILIGLSDWRMDALMLFLHVQQLQAHYWQSRYSIAFPRLNACEGGLSSKTEISNPQLLQLICAMRILLPQVDISLSTREGASLRDSLATLGVTMMSAESQTQPGGYSAPSRALAQFDTEDHRSLTEVEAALKRRGLQPVHTDWLF